MTNDRDEEFLRTKLTDGLHPAEVDLWPTVAEALPNARTAWPWRRIALCLAAPLLIAAGVLAGTAEFTNLRENPRPSFAPEANTGYAITYERQYFTLDSDLLAGLAANHNGEVSADGWLPMSCGINGFLHLPDEDEMNRYSRAVRGYDSWGELTAATDLPLAQNALLDTEANNFAAVSLYPSGMIEIPEEYDGRPYTPKAQEYPAGLIPVGRGETPDKLYRRTPWHLRCGNDGCRLSGRCRAGDRGPALPPKERRADLGMRKLPNGKRQHCADSALHQQPELDVLCAVQRLFCAGWHFVSGLLQATHGRPGLQRQAGGYLGRTEGGAEWVYIIRT